MCIRKSVCPLTIAPASLPTLPSYRCAGQFGVHPTCFPHPTFPGLCTNLSRLNATRSPQEALNSWMLAAGNMHKTVLLIWCGGSGPSVLLWIVKRGSFLHRNGMITKPQGLELVPGVCHCSHQSVLSSSRCLWWEICDWLVLELLCPIQKPLATCDLLNTNRRIKHPGPHFKFLATAILDSKDTGHTNCHSKFYWPHRARSFLSLWVNVFKCTQPASSGWPLIKYGILS